MRSVIKLFKTSDTELLFKREFVRAFSGFDRQALKRLRLLHRAENLTDLSAIRGNRLESLKGDREGQFSVRINDQYRICFRWDGKHAYDVEIVDYH